MSAKEEREAIRGIKPLTDDNFATWSLRIKTHLRQKKLWDVTINPCSLAADAPNVAVIKDSSNRLLAYDTLIKCMSDAAFNSCVDTKTNEDPHRLWNNILERYGSSSINNKGRIWLKFMRFNYNGDLKKYIDECRSYINEFSIINLGIPDDVISISFLAKLTEPLWKIVDSIILNEEIVKDPHKTLQKLSEVVHLQESRHLTNSEPTPKREGDSSALVTNQSNRRSERPPPKHPCSKEKHNKLAYHPIWRCFSLTQEERDRHRPDREPEANVVELMETNSSSAQLLLTCESSIPSKPIVIDSGASHHMVNREALFSNLKPYSRQIGTGCNSSNLVATGIGRISIKNHDGRVFHLDDVLFVPGLNRSLLSLTKLFKIGMKVTKLSTSKLQITLDDSITLLADASHHLFELPVSHFIQPSSSCMVTTSVNVNWHCPLGHPGPDVLKRMFPSASSPTDCDTCRSCKMVKLPFNSNFSPVNRCLETLHLDLVGPISIPSISGYSYFLTIVDQFSGYLAVRFLKSKADTFNQFELAVKLFEQQLNAKLSNIVSDNGTEFKNDSFMKFCSALGITHQFSPPYTPENNGFAERANCSLITKARCLLHQANLPFRYWAEAINTAVDLINLLPSSTRDFQIPYQTWFKKDPPHDKLKPFGCLAYSLIPPDLRINKMHPTGKRMIHLGYLNDYSNFKLLDPDSEKTTSSWHVRFVEDNFPSIFSEPRPFNIPFNLTGHSSETLEKSSSIDLPPPPPSNTIGEPAPSSRLISSRIDTDNILNYDRRGNPIQSYLAEDLEVAEKLTYSKALNSADSSLWRESIKKELDNLELHNVWDVVDRSETDKPLHCTWVFRIKRDAMNNPLEYKSRLCVQGFEEVEGVDFLSTFAPTGKLVSLRLLITLSLKMGWSFHQVDVRSAFLNADLNEYITLVPPKGVDVGSGKVLRLKKAMYGLKQAPLACHKTLTDWLRSVGFKNNDVEPCVFSRRDTFLYIHVDDLAIFSPDPSIFKKEICAKFKIKDLGPASLLLGMKISQSEERVVLSQSHYVQTILDRFGCKYEFPLTTPLEPHTYLIPATDDEVDTFNNLNVNYRAVVGALNFLSITTRPDITFAVSSLSQFLNRPGITHWEACKHTLRYLKGTENYALCLAKPTSSGISLTTHVDSDWAGCPIERKSVSAYVVLWGNNLVSWSSKKQKSTTMSSTEAEYIALCEATKETMWLSMVIKYSLNLSHSPTPALFEDNSGAVLLANNESNHSGFKTKHMDVRYHYVRQMVKAKAITVSLISTSKNLSDFLTKSLNGTSLRRALWIIGCFPCRDGSRRR